MFRVFSPKFVEACLRGELHVGDLLPCPKCGSTEVTYQNPRKWLPIAGGAGVVALALLFTHQMLLGQCVALVAVGIAAGAGFSEPGYTCRNCDFHWRFRDAQKWAEAIRHDDSASPGAPQVSRPL